MTSRQACLTLGEIASELSGSQKGLCLPGGRRLPGRAVPGRKDLDAFYQDLSSRAVCQEEASQMPEEVGLFLCSGGEWQGRDRVERGDEDISALVARGWVSRPVRGWGAACRKHTCAVSLPACVAHSPTAPDSFCAARANTRKQNSEL